MVYYNKKYKESEFNMKILYFTATGNSLYVAKSFDAELISIPQMMKDKKFDFEDEEIGIVFPLYSWLPAPNVIEFLQKASFKCNYLFAIATYGCFSGGVASYLVDISSQYGYKFDYINKIKMVDSYLPGFNMDKQKKDEPKKMIESNLSKIKSDIKEQKQLIVNENFIVTKMSKSMVKMINKDENPNNHKRSIKMHMGKGGIKPYYSVDENCTKCSTCVKVCPVDNIKLQGKNISLDNRCFMCLACVQNCPQKAIHLRGEVSNARFRNSNISLKEIIQSNQ